MPNTEAELSRLGVKKVFIIGGNASVSKEIEDKLSAKGIEITRLSGLDRYETNLKVLENFEFYYGATMFASGQGFADALSGSALAALSNSPIILMDEDMVNRTDITSELAGLKSDVKMKWIIGGEGVIPSSVVYKVFK